MKNLYLTIILGMFLISLASASIGNFNQGQPANLPQTCADCSYNNITLITDPSGNILVKNVQMTKSGVNYNYTLDGSLTTTVGEYTVNGVGDTSGVDTVWMYHFNIGGGNLGFFIVGFILFYGLTFYGLKIEHVWVTLIGCFGLLLLGIYTSFNGVDVYKNTLTSAISYVTIAVGLGIGFQAVKEITYL